ncbi:MAG TPA: NADH-quinone oxidoreductase subunit NuoE [Thermohalobaculum sp.]|nr:NADH-quinone oxidoreductase subunit NuoE [Thermohalobaculum sp.]
MSLRRLHNEQPESFAFTPANQEWAEKQLRKYPPGRQASAVIPLLWRAQEQEGWLTKPAIEHVAGMLDMPAIRALEVATFYFMFQLKPVGSAAHVQVCGTTSCMICGSDDLIKVCREKIAPQAHALSADGKLSWEEVECLGACSNAPMVQIGKDYYEDLTGERLGEIIDALASGEVPTPGPQNGRFASEPAEGLTSLDGERYHDENASVRLAHELGDTVARIRGDEAMPPPEVPAEGEKTPEPPPPEAAPDRGDRFVDSPSADKMAEKPDIGGAESDVPIEGVEGGETDRHDVDPDREKAPKEVPFEAGDADQMPRLEPTGVAEDRKGGAAPGGGNVEEGRPLWLLDRPREGRADDLKALKGVGPKIETALNEAGIWHYDQIASFGLKEIAWVEARLGLSGRFERDDWVGQARALAGRTE